MVRPLVAGIHGNDFAIVFVQMYVACFAPSCSTRYSEFFFFLLSFKQVQVAGCPCVSPFSRSLACRMLPRAFEQTLFLKSSYCSREHSTHCCTHIHTHIYTQFTVKHSPRSSLSLSLSGTLSPLCMFTHHILSYTLSSPTRRIKSPIIKVTLAAIHTYTSAHINLSDEYNKQVKWRKVSWLFTIQPQNNKVTGESTSFSSSTCKSYRRFALKSSEENSLHET